MKNPIKTKSMDQSIAPDSRAGQGLSGRLRASLELRLKRRRGVAMIELALVVPVVLALALNMIQYGRLAHATEIVTNLAREGARFGSQGEATKDADIKKYVLDQAAITYLGKKDMIVTVVPAEGSAARKMGSPITVSVSYDLSQRLFIPARWMVSRYEDNPVKKGSPMYTAAAEMRILDDTQTPVPTPAATALPTPIPTPTTPPPTPTPGPTTPPVPTNTPAPTTPPVPTSTPGPTTPPVPTNTPGPTNTPAPPPPTPKPTATPLPGS